jgi:hypothetical protein
MSELPQKDRLEALEDIHLHGRCIAVEFKAHGVGFDTLVHLADEPDYFEGWEIPSGDIPENRPLMLALDGVYVSDDIRMIGRAVRPLSEKEVATRGAALAVRQKLFALEKKHDIFEKIRSGETGNT